MTSKANFDYLDQYHDPMNGGQGNSNQGSKQPMTVNTGAGQGGLSRQYGGGLDMPDMLDAAYSDENQLPTRSSPRNSPPRSPTRSPRASVGRSVGSPRNRSGLPRSPARTPIARSNSGLRGFSGGGIDDVFDYHQDNSIKRSTSLNMSELELDFNGGDFGDDNVGGSSSMGVAGDLSGGTSGKMGTDSGEAAISRIPSLQGREMLRLLSGNSLRSINSNSGLSAVSGVSRATSSDSLGSGGPAGGSGSLLSLDSGVNSGSIMSDSTLAASGQEIYRGAVGGLAGLSGSTNNSGQQGAVATSSSLRPRGPKPGRMKRYRNSRQDQHVENYNASVDSRSLKRGMHATSSENLMDKQRQENKLILDRLKQEGQLERMQQEGRITASQQQHLQFMQQQSQLQQQMQRLQMNQHQYQQQQQMHFHQQQLHPPHFIQPAQPQALHMQSAVVHPATSVQAEALVRMRGLGSSNNNGSNNGVSLNSASAPTAVATNRTIVPGGGIRRMVGAKGRAAWSGITTSGRKAAQPWTKEEDALLLEGIRLYGAGKWRKISQQLFGQGSARTSDQIGQRWRKVLRPEIQNQHKGKWTEEESEKLAALVDAHGEDWERVAQLMGTRSRKQCKYRWENGIDPHLNRSDWSPDEDAAVLRLVAQIGTHWTKIAESFPGRTDDQVRRRFLKLQNRLNGGSSDSL